MRFFGLCCLIVVAASASACGSPKSEGSETATRANGKSDFDIKREMDQDLAACGDYSDPEKWSDVGECKTNVRRRYKNEYPEVFPEPDA